MESHSINIEYKFGSALGATGANRYVNEYKVHIYNDDETEDPIKRELIGKVEFSLVLLKLMLNQSIDYYHVFDNSEFLCELGQTMIDFETNDFRAHLSPEIVLGNSNLLVIGRFELLPKWRKKSIGKKIIKDIIWRFSGSCDVVMLKAFPLQQEYQYADNQKSDWEKKMQINDLPKDTEFSNKKVYAYYQTLGFTQLENTDYFYLNPAFKNDKFEAIEMDE